MYSVTPVEESWTKQALSGESETGSVHTVYCTLAILLTLSHISKCKITLVNFGRIYYVVMLKLELIGGLIHYHKSIVW